MNPFPEVSPAARISFRFELDPDVQIDTAKVLARYGKGGISESTGLVQPVVAFHISKTHAADRAGSHAQL